jgi:hypothetical protein
MPDVLNLRALRQAMNKLVAQSYQRHDGSVMVGYAASYGLYVHENLSARHTVGQAKFLEQPARELSDNGTLGNIVRTETPRVGLRKALLMAGLRLQRESQQLVPVDTGNLKGSAFTAEG